MAEVDAVQLEVIRAVRAGRNVLMTGPAGSGKTFTIAAILSDLRSTRPAARVGVSAMTGAAAVLLQNGQTFHRLSRCGISSDPAEVMSKMLKAKALVDLDVLVIDEISMMDSQLFLAVEAGARRSRRSKLPFGGLQLILVGDFAQAAPITSRVDGVFAQRPYVFQVLSSVSGLDVVSIALTNNYRQSEDPAFYSLLNNLRVGLVTVEDSRALHARLFTGNERTLVEGGATMLFSTRADVSQINDENLLLLGTPVHTFLARTSISPLRDGGNGSGGRRRALEFYANALMEPRSSISPIEREVRLAVGAEVMLAANLDTEHGFVNGARGRVVRFNAVGNPVVLFKCAQTERSVEPHGWRTDMPDGSVTYTQMPLRLAYALTVHRAQGATLASGILASMGSIFAQGLAYVMLSRATSMEGINLLDVNTNVVRADPRVVEFIKSNCALPPPMVLRAEELSDADLKTLALVGIPVVRRTIVDMLLAPSGNKRLRDDGEGESDMALPAVKRPRV